MQVQTTRVENAILQAPSMPPMRRLSPRTFVHCLHALFVNTKVLAANVVSMHLYVAERAEFEDDTPTLLSQFHLELVGQAVVLQRRATQLFGAPLQPQEWVCYADIWRIAEVSDVQSSITQLLNAADVLAGLYESMLPTAAAQPDQATSFYLLAEHLVILNEYCLALERAIAAIAAPVPKFFARRKQASKISPKFLANFVLLNR